MFPQISRDDADQQLINLIKYLFNYAFYKFGTEFTFLSMILLVRVRADVIAVLYVIWLCILFGVSRKSKRRIWFFFQWFIIISILVQYTVILSLPPFLCSSKLLLYK